METILYLYFFGFTGGSFFSLGIELGDAEDALISYCSYSYISSDGR